MRWRMVFQENNLKPGAQLLWWTKLPDWSQALIISQHPEPKHCISETQAIGMALGRYLNLQLVSTITVPETFQGELRGWVRHTHLKMQ